MITLLFKLAGGIGLFLLGMSLLTDSLKALAGDSLRKALVQFTGSPLKAFLSGACLTLLIQSSSATTVTVIGLVSAGLLSFPQAVGVVIGASFGTTGTGWVVAIFGLKFSVGLYAMPLVGLGVFLKLLTHGRTKALGTAIAGFGLIFVGIDSLQGAMSGMSETIDFSGLDGNSFVGRILLLAIGAMMTIVMQSSSAATATILTAYHTRSISFEQAAALMIGAAIGTTATSALAAIGASVSAQRTALAHILFNLATGLIALVMLPLFLWGIAEAQLHLGLEPGAVSLAAFHSSFVLLGVLIFLPFVHRFAKWIEWLLPERGPTLTRHFDASLLHVPQVALEAAQRSLILTACELFAVVRASLVDPPGNLQRMRVQQVEQALAETQDFLAKIPANSDSAAMAHAQIVQMHAIDHLVRLHAQAEPPATVRRMRQHPQIQPLWQLCREMLQLAIDGLHAQAADEWTVRIEAMSQQLAELRRQQRPGVFAQTATGQWGPTEALELLDAMRWLDRVGYHTWRVCNYLAGSGAAEVSPDGEAEPVAPLQ